MWLLLNESQTESQADAVVIEEPAATGQLHPLPEADTVVIEKPASTGQPPPLPEADSVVIEEPAATGNGKRCN